MTLPTDIVDGRPLHASLHNDVNAEVNRLGDAVDGITIGTIDLDTAMTPGVYYQSSSASATVAKHYPLESATGVIQILATGAVVRTQNYWPTSGPQLNRGFFTRVYLGAAWEPWRWCSVLTISSSAGRAATLNYGDGTNREMIVNYHSGRRDIRSLMAGTSAGKAILVRTNHVVSLAFEGLVFTDLTAATVHTFTGLIPAGFRPVSAIRLPLSTTASTVGSVIVMTNGDVSVVSNTTVSGISPGASWLTEEVMPATLPGVADGTVPVG